MTEENPDFLEVDDAINGQRFVCLSFLSPEAIIEKKDAFYLSKFLQSYCKDLNLEYKEIYAKYEDFVYKHSDKLQRDFDEQNKFQTSIRGLKVRGCYETRQEAEARAKKLQTIDSNFNVFVGDVGKWLPWDPCADGVQDEVFQNAQLNEMMQKYEENNVNRDIFYEEQKRDKIKAAREEVLRKKREEQQQKTKELEDKSDVESGVESGVETVESGVETVESGVETVKEGVETVESGVETVEKGVEEVATEVKEEVHKLNDDVKASLDNVDPWLASKLSGDVKPDQ